MAVCRSAQPGLAALVAGAALKVGAGLGLRRGQLGGCGSVQARSAQLLVGREVPHPAGGAWHGPRWEFVPQRARQPYSAVYLVGRSGGKSERCP